MGHVCVYILSKQLNTCLFCSHTLFNRFYPEYDSNRSLHLRIFGANKVNIIFNEVVSRYFFCNYFINKSTDMGALQTPLQNQIIIHVWTIPLFSVE